ncbi:MAG: hypothetical protein NZZ60_07700 [Bacteroidia bacterium]|nr:hypothetical protein [Bacteroidia bacterium]MCX7652674.1 hypothetical protein [Bacteroidia bacterium]MDW8416972.1 hypothetical protein [Bacteroidia bacterium]
MEALRIAFTGFLLIAFQMLLAPSLSIENLVYPAPYVLFWLMLPFSWSPQVIGVLSVIYGVFMDILFPPYGLHTFCGLWVVALRKLIFRVAHPNLPPEWELTTSTRSLGMGEFFLYAFPLTLLHHMWYFPLAAWELSSTVLLGLGLSTTYSFLWEWIIFVVALRQRHVRN